MINPSGSVTLNGITDEELAHMLEVKAKNPPSVFGFNPAALQTQTNGQQSWYNNATFQFNGEQGLAVAQELISFLLKKDEKAKAQGQ